MVPAPLRAPVHVQRRGPVQGVLLVSTNPCKARCEKTRKVFELYCQQNAVLKKFTANCSLYSVLVLAVCTPVCANSGTCSSPGTCTCTSSWTGSRCATRKYQQIEIGIPKEKRSFHIIFLKKFFGLEFLADCLLYLVCVLALCTPVCSNGGTCSSPGTCTCTALWTGSRCATRKYWHIWIGMWKKEKSLELILSKTACWKVFPANCSLYFVHILAVCTPVCSNGGTCSSPGTCTCTALWTGSRCATRKYWYIWTGMRKKWKVFGSHS